MDHGAAAHLLSAVDISPLHVHSTIRVDRSSRATVRAPHRVDAARGPAPRGTAIARMAVASQATCMAALGRLSGRLGANSRRFNDQFIR